ncbi:MAG: hypothetical protein WD080_01495 [Egibacteraceae bacterium]
MSLLQAWLVIGVPGLVLGLGLFMVRSPARAMAGYVVLVATFAGMALVDRTSAAVLGGLLALLYAAGRGGDLEREERDDDGDGLPAVVGYKQRRAAQES